MLLQQAVPLEVLRQLLGEIQEAEESGLEEAFWKVLPPQAKESWQKLPHRMFTTEAQVHTPQQLKRGLNFITFELYAISVSSNAKGLLVSYHFNCSSKEGISRFFASWRERHQRFFGFTLSLLQSSLGTLLLEIIPL